MVDGSSELSYRAASFTADPSTPALRRTVVDPQRKPVIPSSVRYSPPPCGLDLYGYAKTHRHPNARAGPRPWQSQHPSSIFSTQYSPEHVLNIISDFNLLSNDFDTTAFISKAGGQLFGKGDVHFKSSHQGAGSRLLARGWKVHRQVSHPSLLSTANSSFRQRENLGVVTLQSPEILQWGWFHRSIRRSTPWFTDVQEALPINERTSQTCAVPQHGGHKRNPCGLDQ
mmetsp:Transcript_422/g.748  ORF Transcript_422/g.748 Transcript_422/m.748 type:complete len:227 (-) Transcript_422:2186-2866(-)